MLLGNISDLKHEDYLENFFFMVQCHHSSSYSVNSHGMFLHIENMNDFFGIFLKNEGKFLCQVCALQTPS